MNRLAKEVGESILKAHVVDAGLSRNTRFLPPEITAVGYSAGLEQSVSMTKQRVPMMVTMGSGDARETLYHFCVRSHNNTKWKRMRQDWAEVSIEQNISQDNFTSIWVRECVLLFMNA